jgi:hypothetical protein
MVRSSRDVAFDHWFHKDYEKRRALKRQRNLEV